MVVSSEKMISFVKVFMLTSFMKKIKELYGQKPSPTGSWRRMAPLLLVIEASFPPMAKTKTFPTLARYEKILKPRRKSEKKLNQMGQNGEVREFREFREVKEVRVAHCSLNSLSLPPPPKKHATPSSSSRGAAWRGISWGDLYSWLFWRMASAKQWRQMGW